MKTTKNEIRNFILEKSKLTPAEFSSINFSENTSKLVTLSSSGRYLNQNRSDRLISLSVKQKANVFVFFSKLEAEKCFENLQIILPI